MQRMENYLWMLLFPVFLVSIFLKTLCGNNAIVIDGGD